MDKHLDCLNKKEKKVVKAFIKDLRRQLGDYIIKVQVFGSKIRGDFEEYSDIDIFILVKDNKDIRDKISDISAEYFFRYEVPLSPVVYSLSEYKKNKELGSFFLEEIEKEGILL
jgi:predicted nucleotidyltransferase